MGLHRDNNIPCWIFLGITCAYLIFIGVSFVWYLPKVCIDVGNVDTYNLYMQGISLCTYSDWRIRHFVEECGEGYCTMNEFKDVIKFIDINGLYFMDFEKEKIMYLFDNDEFNTMSLLKIYGGKFSPEIKKIAKNKIYENMHNIERCDELIEYIAIHDLDIVLIDKSIDTLKHMNEDDLIKIIRKTKRDDIIAYGLEALGINMTPIEYKAKYHQY